MCSIPPSSSSVHASRTRGAGMSTAQGAVLTIQSTSRLGPRLRQRWPGSGCMFCRTRPLVSRAGTFRVDQRGGRRVRGDEQALSRAWMCMVTVSLQRATCNRDHVSAVFGMAPWHIRTLWQPLVALRHPTPSPCCMAPDIVLSPPRVSGYDWNHRAGRGRRQVHRLQAEGTEGLTTFSSSPPPPFPSL